jgi:hypothetical protein
MAKRRIARVNPNSEATRRKRDPREEAWRKLYILHLRIKIQADKIDGLRAHIFKRGIGEPPAGLDARLESGRDALAAAVSELRDVAAVLEYPKKAEVA